MSDEDTKLLKAQNPFETFKTRGRTEQEFLSDYKVLKEQGWDKNFRRTDIHIAI